MSGRNVYVNALRSDDGFVAAAPAGALLGAEQPTSFSVNLRDVGAVDPARLRPGVLFRSSQVVSTTELAALNIQTVLDLRQPPILCKAQHRNFWQSVKRMWMGAITTCFGGGRSADASAHSGSASNLANPSLLGLRRESGRRLLSDRHPTTLYTYRRHMKHAAPCWRCTASCDQQYGVEATVFHVDLLPRGVSLHILFELPRRLQAKVLVCALRGQQPEPIVAGAVADPTVMGYLRLYQILLEKSKANLARALRLFTDPDNLPVLVHCIHGKDRTGLVVMLLLLLCGVAHEVIIKDYAQSEVLLREGRDKNHLDVLQAYLTTDQVIAATRAVMEATISHIRNNYGTAQRYALEIGLNPREISAIRRNLMREDFVADG